MKKIFILAIAICFGLSGFAQKGMSIIPENLRNIKAERPNRLATDLPMMTQETNPYVSANHGKAVNETQIGETVYDLQTNQSVRPMCYLYSDNTVAGVWTFGTTPSSFPERGTGYNYYDGSLWSTWPTARLESVRNGWGNIQPLGAGEIVVAHNGNTGLLISTRPAKGTGAWTEQTLVGPTTSGGTTALLWPRAITSGNTIHIIATTDQAVAPAVYTYQGLQLALVYYRSTDGGATWSAPAILPGMDSASIIEINNKGFGGDSYSWAAPKGDTIAFVIGDSWSDVFVMKSFDGGDTWTKVTAFDFPDLSGIPAPTPVIPSGDGSLACAIDNNGDAHVVFGHMRVSDDDYLDTDGATSYYPYTDGLVYWNESMPTYDTTDVADPINWIAAMFDYSGNGDTIDFPTVGQGEWPFGNYFLSLTSMPQILIANGEIVVTYSACREDRENSGATPNAQLYRHLFGIRSTDGGATWSLHDNDLTSDVIHDFDECVFGSLSYTSNGAYHMVYQADEEPGLSVRGDLDGATTNRMYYLNFNFITGVQENQEVSTEVSLYPNPVSNYANISIVLAGQKDVSISISNLLGQTVFAKNYGTMGQGSHVLTINTSNLTSGIYFYSVNADNEKVTHKFVVE